MTKLSDRKAIVAGHICLDILPRFLKKEFKCIEDIMIPGHLIQMDKCDINLGGVVSNTGLAMKFLGANVSLMGKIGTDSFGELVLSLLNKRDAADGIIISDQYDTSYSIGLAIPGIDRIFLHYPGANDSYYYDDIDFDKVKEATLFHFGYPPIMKSIYENNGKELIKIFKKVKELDTATSLDMCGVDENSEAGKVDWEELIKDILPYLDFFVPSAEELCYMIDKPRYKEWNERAKNGSTDITSILNIQNDVKPLADQLISWGAKVLMIKCGAEGVYLRTGSKDRVNRISGGLPDTMTGWADVQYFEASYKPDRILSGGGAGDTCIAAFLCSVLNGYPLKKSLRYAAATGAACVSAYDALGGLMSFDELEQKINAGWEKNLPNILTF